MFGHNTQKSQEFKIISQKVQCHCRSETWYHCVRKSNIVFIIEVTLFRQQSLDLFRSGFRTAAPSFGGMSEVFSWPRPRLTPTAWSTTRWSSLSSRKTRQVIYIYLYFYIYVFYLKYPLFVTEPTPPTPPPGGPPPPRGWVRGGRSWEDTPTLTPATPSTPPTSSPRRPRRVWTPRATPRSWGPRCLTTRGGDTESSRPARSSHYLCQ